MTKKQIDDEVMELKPTSKKQLQGKRLVVWLIGIGVVVFALLAFLAVKFLFNTEEDSNNQNPKNAASNVTAAQQVETIYDMDELIINLVSTDNNRRYLKIMISLRMANAADAAVVVAKLASIQDGLQMFLKELRPQDFNGSGATMRLKEELTKRINKAIYPVEVQEVLLREILLD